ncbi:homoserine O-acetyltransferase [Naumannella halotolerans]|uniref:homoserine O-acetyltransferase MetX n=1 Tax=Naumannella halotolerans TaxID=993414 RepID=UPI00370DBCE6
MPTVRLYDADQPLTLASGQQLELVDVAYTTHGTLNESGDNAVFICHALTGDAQVIGPRTDGRPGWWETMVGPGRPIDTDRYFVICPNLLGGCQGTTGPSCAREDGGEIWGLDFPLLQMADFVTVHRALAAHLGVRRLHAAVGGSLGGMQVLQWALDHPEDLRHAVIIAASSRLTAQNIAFSAVAREAILRDPGFAGGRYGETGSVPSTGLSIARMMAHITYLSEEAMSEKFGRRFQSPGRTGGGFGIDFAVESYLAHQATSFLNRFDALSYLYLSRVMDYFDPFATEGVAARAAEVGTDFCVISFDSDWRFDTGHSLRIVDQLLDSGASVTFREIPSPWGHDSFLLDVDRYQDTVRAFLSHHGPEEDGGGV